MTDIPIACNMSALTPEQRQRRAALADHIKVKAEVYELPDGYVFSFANDEMWMTVAEFVDLERRCCPFFTFALEREMSGTVTLRLTGPEGTKEFIAAEILQE